MSQYQRREFPADLASVARIDAFLRALLSTLPLDEEAAADLRLCLNEAVSNAIDHGSHFRGEMPVVIEYRVEPDRLVFLLSDSGGQPFDPGFFRDMAARKDWSVGGRGILIMHELMDEVGFFFIPGKRTTVMLVKQLKR